MAVFCIKNGEIHVSNKYVVLEETCSRLEKVGPSKRGENVNAVFIFHTPHVYISYEKAGEQKFREMQTNRKDSMGFQITTDKAILFSY